MTTAIQAGHIPVFTRGDRLRRAREDTGMTQRRLAEVIGVSQKTITDAEGDRRQPRRILINAWSLATGVPADWLMTGKCAIRDSNPEPADVVPLFGGDAA